MSTKAKAAAALANRILPGIQCFAWNHDRSLVAVCPFSREILIFATNQKPDIKDWRLVEVLREVSLSLYIVRGNLKISFVLPYSTTQMLILSSGTQSPINCFHRQPIVELLSGATTLNRTTA